MGIGSGGSSMGHGRSGSGGSGGWPGGTGGTLCISNIASIRQDLGGSSLFSGRTTFPSGFRHVARQFCQPHGRIAIGRRAPVPTRRQRASGQGVRGQRQDASIL